MIINFNEIKSTPMENFHGGEKTTFVSKYSDELNSIMKVTLESGATIGLHRHIVNSEIVYILSGKGKMITDGNTEELCAGMCSYCPAGSEHTLINTGDEELVMFAVIPRQIETAD